PLRSLAQERSTRGCERGASPRAESTARPPAALRSFRGSRRLSIAAIRAHARRPVLAVEFPGAPAAAVHRGAASPRPNVGLHQPRHGVLGTADAIRGSFGDHADSPGRGIGDPIMLIVKWFVIVFVLLVVVAVAAGQL